MVLKLKLYSLRKNKMSQDQVDKLINQAPPSKTQVNTNIGTKIKTYCTSRIGITWLSFPLFFMLLLIIQPKFIFKRNNEGIEMQTINYTLVVIVSIISSLIVYFVPLSIWKKGGSS